MQGKIKKLIDNNALTFPLTVSDAVYVETGKNLRQKLEEMRSGVDGDTTTYVVELNKWGIVKGSQGKPPYTANEWALAYNNALGMNKALAYANSKGFGKVVMPRGTYSFCYTNLTGAVGTSSVSTSITLFSNQVLDMNGSTFEAMYDSLAKNPYDLSPSSNESWRLGGLLMLISGCYNTHVINGTIIGDIPNRSFSDGGTGFNSEKGMENTYGIAINRSSYCSVDNVDSSMFMGDGVSIGASPFGGDTDIARGNITCSPGYLGDDGVVVATAGAYISPTYAIDPKKFSVIQMRTGGGYTRIPSIKAKHFYYVFLNSTGGFIKRQPSVYLQNVTVPYNAASVRLQFVNEDEGLTSLTTIKYAITRPQCNNIKVSGCKIHDNHRGGISGGADFTLIEYCQIYRNGEDSGLGIPVFPDTTRYAMDFEDSYCNYLMVENNEISSGFNGLLLGVYHTRVVGNIFNNISGVVVYNNANAIISENVFYNASLILTDTEINQERTITFKNNTVYNGPLAVILDTTLFPSTKVKVHGNTFYIESGTLIGDIDVSNNYFKSYSGSAAAGHVGLRINVNKLVNNTFEDFPTGTGYSHRVSINKVVNSSQEIRGNTFIGVTFSSDSIDNNAEFLDSRFFNCEISNPPKDKTKSRNITFTDCELTDTYVAFGGEYINDLTNGGLKTTVTFDRCKIVLTDSYPRLMWLAVVDNKTNAELVAAGKLGRNYEVIINRSIFENRIISKNNYLFKWESVNNNDIIQNKVVRFKNSVINLSDPTKFTLLKDDTGNLAVLENTDYVGFTGFSTPTGDKLQTYLETYMVRGSAAPVGNKEKAVWFNTTTNKVYWWSGTVWLDAMGNP